MKDQLERQLVKVLEKSLEIAEKTGEFVIDQAPELLREFYLWHTVKNSMVIMGCILAFTMLRYMYRKFPTEEEKHYDVMNLFGKLVHYDFAVPYVVIGGFSSLFLIFVFCIHIMNLAQIIVAPKLYLIEHLIDKV